MSILRADSIRDRAGTGAPDFPNGLTGNVTGTASTATVATNAQGLTGTPNITVGTVGCGNVTSTGDVTGVNATFSGNLTVQGTTTTIDTAITAVDSLQIDGSLKVGTTQDSSYPDRLVSVGSTIRTSSYLDIRSTTTGALLFADGLSGDSAYRGQVEYRHNDDSMRLWTAAGERLRIKSDGTTLLNGTAIFKGGLAEKYRKGSTLAAASNNVALTSGNVHRFTSNESGAKTVNFTGVHSTLEDGQSVSFTVLVTPANAGYINAATVDGVAPGGGLKWSGGSAPSAGGASGRDVYTFTIFKDGTATDSYEIFGAVQNYA
jgi:hypothetical protein